jgi:hypothetical protein
MKTVKVRLWVIILVVALLTASIWALFKVSGARYQKEKDRLNIELFQANRENEQYTIQVNDLNEYVSELEVVVLSSDKDILRLKEEGERLKAQKIKDVKLIGSLQATINVLKDSIPPSDTIIIEEKRDGRYIKLPLHYSFKDNYAYMVSTVNDFGMSKMDFGILETPINLAVGTKKEGMFKRGVEVVSVSTPNPYVDLKVNSFAVTDQTKSNWPYVAIGAGGAIGVVLLLNFLVQ